jgi:NtrC-family two-component system response regulator AlgB
LQEREYERVGENIPRHADVRIISATNRDLGKAVAEGAFREDLYYRLNVISLHMPPLRERAADVERLALLYLNFSASHTGKSVRAFAPAAVEALRSYSWPGNLRELRNVIDVPLSLAIMNESRSMIFPTAFLRPQKCVSAANSLEQIEAEHIRRPIISHKTSKKSPTSFRSTRRRCIEKKENLGLSLLRQHPS